MSLDGFLIENARFIRSAPPNYLFEVTLEKIT
jgi:hypothetical protein